MDAAGFDQWYADMARSERRDAIVVQALGLPPELESSSLLSWDGIGDVVELLGLAPGQVLIDLACGRGGYGVEIATRTGVRLIGVDFSTVALDRARRRAGAAGVDAEYVLGDLVTTTLPDVCADAIVCVDALQFAEPYAAGVAECRRVLRPGGRIVLTGWEALDPDDPVIPARLRRDLGAEFRAGGFVDVRVVTMSAWRDAERAYWELAVAEDSGDDPAVESLRREGERVLAWLRRSRRVAVSARIT